MDSLADKLKRSKPGETQEETQSLTGQAGLYRHPGSGEELITLYDPLTGDAQSEAAIRVGFERVRDAKPEEVKVLATASLQNETDKAAYSDNTDAIKGIQARLNANEAETAQLREENERLKSGLPQTDLSQAAAVEEADAQTAARGTDNTGALATDSNVGGLQGSGADASSTVSDETEEEDTTDEPKALNKQNKTELLATAEAEGVENVSSENSNKELVAAIEAKRQEGSE